MGGRWAGRWWVVGGVVGGLVGGGWWSGRYEGFNVVAARRERLTTWPRCVSGSVRHQDHTMDHTGQLPAHQVRALPRRGTKGF